MLTFALDFSLYYSKEKGTWQKLKEKERR